MGRWSEEDDDDQDDDRPIEEDDEIPDGPADDRWRCAWCGVELHAHEPHWPYCSYDCATAAHTDDDFGD